jgi:hypothetical protein
MYSIDNPGGVWTWINFIPSLQLGRGALYRRQHQISNLSRRLVKPVTEPIAPQTLTDNVELQAASW